MNQRDLPGLVALSIGLAMDATAAAGARGIAVRSVRPSRAIRLALLFGGFQALMPLIGWTLGRQLGGFMAAWDHWIAFVLLGGIGAKMIHEALSANEDDEVSARGDPFAWRTLLVLAVATSIDAFAAGITLPMLHVPIAISLATIGLTTAALSYAGVYAGRRFGAVLGSRLDVFGGVVLIALGAKILFEHLSGRA
jgi:putative Mn2+ efflux pump MntP